MQKTENQRMVGLEETTKFQLPAVGTAATHEIRLSRVLTNLALN